MRSTMKNVTISVRNKQGEVKPQNAVNGQFLYLKIFSEMSENQLSDGFRVAQKAISDISIYIGNTQYAYMLNISNTNTLHEQISYCLI